MKDSVISELNHIFNENMDVFAEDHVFKIPPNSITT